MIEEGQSVPNPDSDFSNRLLDHVFQIYFQEEGETEVGGTRRIFAGCFEKSRRKNSKN